MQIGDRLLEFPTVMGVLNVTPDSFSDGGKYRARDAALRRAEAMLAAGAGLLDVGGESTRPGARRVSASEELDRLMPVLEALPDHCEVPVSVDTSKPEVMRAVVAAGATMINDVTALREEGAVQAIAELGVSVRLMHMLGEPGTMQDNPVYKDVTQEVAAFLGERLECCVGAGINADRIVLDPGFGFGKTHAHNVELLAKLRELRVLGRPLLVGLSRKSTLGVLTGKGPAERMPASIAAAVIAAMNGADIIRAHDVAETVDALRIVAACRDSGSKL